MRLDTEAARSRDHNFEIHRELPYVEFAPQGVLTTDIPGHHGYSGGQLEGIQPPSVENLDRASLYTVFGGTSAASALVAGAVTLLQSSKRPERGGKPLSGSEVKAKLKLSGAKEVRWPWLEKLLCTSSRTIRTAKKKTWSSSISSLEPGCWISGSC